MPPVFVLLLNDITKLKGGYYEHFFLAICPYEAL